MVSCVGSPAQGAGRSKVSDGPWGQFFRMNAQRSGHRGPLLRHPCIHPARTAVCDRTPSGPNSRHSTGSASTASARRVAALKGHPEGSREFPAAVPPEHGPTSVCRTPPGVPEDRPTTFGRDASPGKVNPPSVRQVFNLSPQGPTAPSIRSVIDRTHPQLQISHRP